MSSQFARVFWVSTLGIALSGSACSPTPTAAHPDPEAAGLVVAEVDKLIDGWHEAAARADERAYFDALAEGAVFLGTDETERWSKDAFRAYAHPHFAKGKAWSFRATRRDVRVSESGQIAWFDETLATENLGPARGSGVVELDQAGRARIVHYNLTITVPNERFDEVKALLAAPKAKALDVFQSR